MKQAEIIEALKTSLEAVGGITVVTDGGYRESEITSAVVSIWSTGERIIQKWYAPGVSENELNLEITGYMRGKTEDEARESLKTIADNVLNAVQSLNVDGVRVISAEPELEYPPLAGTIAGFRMRIRLRYMEE